MKKETFMKYLGLLSLTFMGLVQAQTFDGIVCRKYDYYQLGGDRKVFEVSITKSVYDLYNLQISNIYEVRQSDGTFKIRDQANAVNPIVGMSCTQALAEDPKVITCRVDKEESFDYLSIARIDRTGIMSAMASEPGKVTHYSSYDIELLAGRNEEIYRQFDLDDCVLKE
jgi:hypothetical protein